MTRTHAALISLLLGLAVVLGMLAAVRTTGLGEPTGSAAASSVVAKQRRLDRAEAQLRRALARRPPALPAARLATPAVSPRVTYVRPAPTVAPRAAFEEHEDEADEGSDD